MGHADPCLRCLLPNKLIQRNELVLSAHLGLPKMPSLLIVANVEKERHDRLLLLLLLRRNGLHNGGNKGNNARHDQGKKILLENLYFTFNFLLFYHFVQKYKKYKKRLNLHVRLELARAGGIKHKVHLIALCNDVRHLIRALSLKGSSEYATLLMRARNLCDLVGRVAHHEKVC